MANISKDLIARNASANAITGQLDQSGSYPTGHLSIYTSDGSRITWHTLSTPAFGTAVDGTSTAYLIYDATGMISPDATAHHFRFERRDGSSVWSGAVSLNGGGAPMQLESIVIPKDSTVTISNALYVVPV